MASDNAYIASSGGDGFMSGVAQGFNTRKAIDQSREENETRNAYARAMRAGGGVEQLQQEQQGLAQRGNMSGADLLGQRIAQMNETDRKHYADVAERTGGTFETYLDHINNASKKYVKSGMNPNEAMQRAATDAGEWYGEQYYGMPEEMRKFYPHPAKVNPATAMTVIGQAGMVKMKMFDKEKQAGTPTSQKEFELANAQWRDKSQEPGYDKAYNAWLSERERQKGAAHGAGLAETKTSGPQFDLQTGMIVRPNMANYNKWSADAEKEGKTRFIDASDPNVKTVQQTMKYLTTGETFVKRLETLGDSIEQSMKKAGINSNTKLVNALENMYNKHIIGKGEYEATMQALKGYSNEVGKLESGSFGAAGATVEAMKSFNVNPNISVGEFMKYRDYSKKNTKTITDAAKEQLRTNYDRVYAGTGYELPERVKKILGEDGKSESTSSGRVKVKSKDGRIGTIPQSQLNDALAQGYTRVE